MSETTQLSRAVLEETLANMFSNPKYAPDYLFYAHMLGQCSVKLEEMPAAAAVSFHLDHYNLHINPLEFDKFTLEERLAVLKHEMLHILNNHVMRKQDRKMKPWNYATDCAINQLINQAHLPQGCILPANFPSDIKVPNSLSSEQYYEYIRDMEDDDESNGNGNGQPGDHDKWEESEGDEELQKDITKNMIEKSINQTQKSKGNIPGEIADYLEMFSRKSEVCWKKETRRIVGNKKVNKRKTVMRRDRRNPNFEWIKGTTKDRIFELVIVGDESGSVSNDELVNAIAETQHICKLTKTPLWYVPVDTRAHTPQQISQKQRNFKRSACGGTVLAPAIAKIAEHKLHADAILVITDGYIDQSDIDTFQATGKPVFWLITSRGKVQDSMSAGRMKVFQLKAQES